MQLNTSIATTLLVAAALALPALASAAGAVQAEAAGQNSSVGTLTVNNGVVMLSRDGAPFTSGASDESVFHDERLMVSGQSSATIVYSNGCRFTFDKPGVYDIGAHCVAAVLPTAASHTIPTGLIVAGAVVTGGVVAAVLNHKHHHVHPVSH